MTTEMSFLYPMMLLEPTISLQALKILSMLPLSAGSEAIPATFSRISSTSLRVRARYPANPPSSSSSPGPAFSAASITSPSLSFEFAGAPSLSPSRASAGDSSAGAASRGFSTSTTPARMSSFVGSGAGFPPCKLVSEATSCSYFSCPSRPVSSIDLSTSRMASTRSKSTLEIWSFTSTVPLRKQSSNPSPACAIPTRLSKSRNPPVPLMVWSALNILASRSGVAASFSRVNRSSSSASRYSKLSTRNSSTSSSFSSISLMR